jgi:DNA-binding NarL/FixJ family response regulator
VVRSAESAIEAMRQGAYDYLLKPLDLQKLDHVISESLKVARVMRERVAFSPEVETPPEREIASLPNKAGNRPAAFGSRLCPSCCAGSHPAGRTGGEGLCSRCFSLP